MIKAIFTALLLVQLAFSAKFRVFDLSTKSDKDDRIMQRKKEETRGIQKAQRISKLMSELKGDYANLKEDTKKLKEAMLNVSESDHPLVTQMSQEVQQKQERAAMMKMWPHPAEESETNEEMSARIDEELNASPQPLRLRNEGMPRQLHPGDKKIQDEIIRRLKREVAQKKLRF